MTILIVEDERRLAEALKQIMREQKYMADVVYDGNDGLRRKKIQTPILMLTAKDTIGDKVSGLDNGADDYMTKPFAPEELLARVKALTRRRGEVVLDESEYGDFSFNASTGFLSKGAKSVHLNFKEAEIIKLLIASRDTIISKDDIITKVWGYDSDAGSNNVEAYISFLRRKLNFINSSAEIKAVKKMGYRLEKGDV